MVIKRNEDAASPKSKVKYNCYSTVNLQYRSHCGSQMFSHSKPILGMELSWLIDYLG